MTQFTQHIVSLAETLAAHLGKTHWTVSGWISSKSDFIDRLKKGGDCSTGTYEVTMLRFSKIWPDDLEWPSDIPRPQQKKEAAA